MIKKWTALLLTGLLVHSMTGCGEKTEAQMEGNAGNTETAPVLSSDGSVLIAYFTAAENSGVDAEASVSYSIVEGEAKGRLQAVAEMIQAKTGGELFSIKTDVVYPADGGELIDYAAKEQDEDARPALTSQVEDFDSYDVVFVGYPKME